MILIDTGPIVALLDKDDAHYAACVDAAKKLPPQPLMTTWPCLTEGMYLLGEAGGWRYQAALWKLCISEKLILHDHTLAEIDRMAFLMEKYSDLPMDMADASLMAVAESLSLHRIFTLDSDFYVYRLPGGGVFEIIRPVK